MSGHSKFANIKHKKEKNDAKKGKIFTGNVAESVCQFLNAAKEPNKIPSNDKSEEI